jgi:hypothetical protein
VASISFQFEYDHGLVVLPIVVNGKRTIRVVLDTGMPGDGLLLFNTSKVADIGFNFTNRLVASGDSSKTISVNLADGIVLDFPGLRLPNQSVLVIEGNPFLAQQDIDGIIGYALFSRYGVQLNFEKALFRGWAKGEFNGLDEYCMLPLTFRGGFPYVPCTVEMQNGDSVFIQAFLDLGSTSALSLNVKSHPEFKFSIHAIESKVSSALGGSVSGHIGRINALDLGGFSLKGVIAASCEGNLARCVDQPEIHEGNIGTGVLNRFDVVIDYSGSRLFLKPNAAFENPYNFNMSGISVRKMKLGHFLIEQITPNSPAVEAGLQPYDIIVRVNGIQANQIAISEMNRILVEDGAPFEVVVSRKHTLMKCIVSPRTLI